MAIDPRRLLGFAFAGADLLIEVDDKGVISLVLGAAKGVVGEDEAHLTGRFFGGLFAPMDRPVAEALASGLEDGARRGPLVLRLGLDPRKAVILNAHCLAGNGGRASMSLSAAATPALETDPRDGLMGASSFEAFAQSLAQGASLTGQPLEMAMIEFAGLDEVYAGLDAPQRDLLTAAIAGAVRAEAHAGSGAARLSGERFALLREVGESAQALAGRLSRLATAACPASPPAIAVALALDANGDIQRIGRAVRFALEDFAREGIKQPGPVSLSDAMNQAVQRTLARAGDLGVAISQKRFKMAYQPVVDIRTGVVHHHEALVRFEAGDSPFGMIRLAEEFDLIEELDRAIIEMVITRLKANPKEKLAANVSGRTITSSNFIDRVLGRIRKDPTLRGRLIFEVTESATIQDLGRAEKHIQALREAGSLVCLDDFGAGAASFAYLQQLTLDIVKIDGRYVRELTSNGREGAMVRHLVHMCSELRIRTVAEMVENAQIEAAAREAGVDFAQGYLYGEPAEIPTEPVGKAKPAARRVGAVESWG
ncbi:MAG: diguanylate phosphodiesterase [Caulobacteraceae bacterium]|nr:diguanylate phosphodiesterase [Caulobacteraceae bacterium]